MKFIRYLGHLVGESCDEGRERTDDNKDNKSIDVENVLKFVDFDEEDNVDAHREES